MIVDDGLEDIRWVSGLGGKRLPAASCAHLPNLKKCSYLPSERDLDLSSSVFWNLEPKCVCIIRLAGARHVSPAVL